MTFFGLAINQRVAVFTQIHEIVFPGQGGYDWDTVYNMPIWLRRFTFETLKKWYAKPEEDVVAASTAALRQAPTHKIKAPDFVTKALTKK